MCTRNGYFATFLSFRFHSEIAVSTNFHFQSNFNVETTLMNDDCFNDISVNANPMSVISKSKRQRINTITHALSRSLMFLNKGVHVFVLTKLPSSRLRNINDLERALRNQRSHYKADMTSN